MASCLVYAAVRHRHDPCLGQTVGDDAGDDTEITLVDPVLVVEVFSDLGEPGG